MSPSGHYASQGPEIHHVEIEGDQLKVETSPVDSVWLVGQGARSTVVMGGGISHARLPLDKLAGGWARLVIRDREGRRAWSNPLTV